jgi:SAM-dependent methyltransferases related to tRNA (uracil-5-)-methyltransferase
MPNCPLADDCPSFSERIEGMGCQHYEENRGGAEWCQHYGMPISELKQQPVKPGEEVIVEVDDIHESGAGVGNTEDGFIVFVDGLLPPARAKVRINRVKDSHARAKKIVERLPMDEADDEEAADDADGDMAETDSEADDDTGIDDESTDHDEELGSRENFWGG